MAGDRYRHQVTGRMNNARGKLLEQLIENSCRLYEEEGRALIEKTPEPVKQLGAMDKQGRFLACYEKRAQPDYKGVLLGGKCIVIEAKHTNGMCIQMSRVTPHQLDKLLEYENLGTEAYIIVEFGDGSVRRFSAFTWAGEQGAGKKYADARPEGFGYSIREEYGIIKVLEGIV